VTEDGVTPPHRQLCTALDEFVRRLGRVLAEIVSHQRSTRVFPCTSPMISRTWGSLIGPLRCLIAIAIDAPETTQIFRPA